MTLAPSGRRRRGDRLDHRGAARPGRLERGRAHGDHLDRVPRLHGRERVARVDRPHERVGGLDAGDVGELRDVELRRDPRHHVLAAARRRRHQVRVAPLRDHREDLRGEVLGGRLREVRRVDVQHLRDAPDGRGVLRRARRIVPRDEHVDLPGQLRRGRDRVVGGRLDGRVVVFGEDEDHRKSGVGSRLAGRRGRIARVRAAPSPRCGASRPARRRRPPARRPCASAAPPPSASTAAAPRRPPAPPGRACPAASSSPS